MAGGKGPHQNIGGDSSFTTTSLATMGDKGSTKLKPTAPENRTHWKAGTSVTTVILLAFVAKSSSALASNLSALA